MAPTSLPRALLSGPTRRCATTTFSPSNRTRTPQRAMLSSTQLQVSAGEDPAAMLEQATALVEPGGKWQLCNAGKGVERQFHFKTFKATWEFMDHVATECKQQKHHPEWTNVYSRTHVRWTTHRPEGLSSKDLYMAQYCDQAAQQFGELPIDENETKILPSTRLDAGDCCAGKKS